MSHPLIWPSKTYFYPIGNTSAVSVTADLSPEEPACVLLLGCGDPRNILHTVATETHNRPLDFTCCDIEPAVLARNVLLFSLIADGQASATIWNVFYHFRLDAKSHKVLIEQCKKLIDLSESPQKWRESPYGGSLKMATDYTLAELRRHWELYAAMPDLPAQRRKAIEQEFSTEARKIANNGRISPVTRSLGPLLIQGTEVVAPSLTQYWRSGTTFTDGKSLAEATILNPTFVYSLAGDVCSVHYVTDPLIPFHLAPAFAEARTPTLQQVVKCAKAQFDKWCTFFAASLSNPNPPAVRFIVGDAMAVCHSLRVFATTGVLKPGIPVAQWKTQLIQFNAWEYVDGPHPAPTSFNAIHTSNLEDHIGLLNVLIPSAPLLSDNPSSVLYTESLLALASDPTKEFIEHLKADLTVMGLVLGICPVDYLCGFTSRSNTHELLNVQRSSPKKKNKEVNLDQFQQIVIWRSPSSCDAIASQMRPLPPSFDPYQMATFFYDVYQSLYAQETSTNFWNKHSGKSPEGVRRAVGSSNITAFYTREAFVLFLKSVKDRLQPNGGDWATAVSRFDTRLLGSWSKSNMETMHYQDLIGQLHRYGLFTTTSFFMHRARKIGPLAPWPTVPELVRIVLVVPRHELHVLEGSKAEEVGTPPLHCEIHGANCSNLFTSVHAAFGRAVSVGTKDKPQVVFEEDLAGWKGKSPLVLSFTAPSNLLTELDHPNNLSVSFAIRNTPAACITFAKTLGPFLRIFSAKLMDSSLVYILPEPPLPARRLQSSASSAQPTPLGLIAEIGKADRAVLDFDEDCEHVSTLAIRVNVTDEQSLKLFTAEGGKAVPEVEQISACVVKIALGVRAQHLVFPFPVVGSQQRLRLARKSQYIEVLVPTSRSFMEEGMKFNPYPIIRNGGTVFPWSIHRINPSTSPVFKVNTAKGLSKWLGMHVASTMSNREQKLRKKRKHDALMFVKDTIQTIFAYAAGIQESGKARRIFQLVDEKEKNSDTILFIDELRLDGASHTVMCDGYVFAGTPAWIMSIMGTPMEKAFGQLLTNAEVVKVPIFAGEMQGWKQLIPSFVERCRTWTHSANCEYKVEGNTIPLSEEMEQVPICSCGQGKEVDGMLGVPLWKPFAPYVTRIAISPLFAVSYLESVGRARGRGQGRKCEVCRGKGKEEGGGLKTCARCKKVRYCSDECQKKDWKTHKPKCKA